MPVYEDDLDAGSSGVRPVIRVQGRRSGLDVRAIPGSSTIVEGPPGKSAYQLAVEEGYTGTLDEWVVGQIPTVVLTQAEYQALETVEPNTLYFVTV